MQRSETAALLTYVFSVQGGEPTPVVVAAWHDLIGDVDISDAWKSVKHHFATQKRRIWPADIIESRGPGRVMRDGILWVNGTPAIGGPDGMTLAQFDKWQAEQEDAAAERFARG